MNCTGRRIPKFIYLFGNDGSGKSTLCIKLQEHLTSKGFRTKYVWLRMNYMLTRPVLLYCRLTGLTKRIMVEGRYVSIHQFQNSKTIAKLVQYLHLIDTLIALSFKACIPMLLGKTIICDRFVYDILIDFVIESGEKNIYDKVISKLFLCLIPKGAKVFLIKADRDVIASRRKNIFFTEPMFDLRQKEYEIVMKKYGIKEIMNNGDLKQTADMLITEVING